MNNEVKQVTLNEVFPLMEEKLKAGGSVVFKPKGVSMLPLIRQGIDSALIVQTQGPLKKNQIPLYRRQDGSFILHRAVKVCKDKTYVMCGDNQVIYEPNVTDSQIIGVLSGVYRGDRLISVSSFKFKLYSKYVPVRRFFRRMKNFFKRAIGWGLRKCKILK